MFLREFVKISSKSDLEYSKNRRKIVFKIDLVIFVILTLVSK